MCRLRISNYLRLPSHLCLSLSTHYMLNRSGDNQLVAHCVLCFYMNRCINLMKQSLLASNINFLKLFSIQCLNNQTTFFFMNQVVESFELVRQLILYIYVYI